MTTLPRSEVHDLDVFEVGVERPSNEAPHRSRPRFPCRLQYKGYDLGVVANPRIAFVRMLHGHLGNWFSLEKLELVQFEEN